MSTLLQSGVNSTAVKNAILVAARRKFGQTVRIEPSYEHGHWWVRVTDPAFEPDACEATYDVVDAAGGDSVNGFDFEEV